MESVSPGREPGATPLWAESFKSGGIWCTQKISGVAHRIIAGFYRIGSIVHSWVSGLLTGRFEATLIINPPFADTVQQTTSSSEDSSPTTPPIGTVPEPPPSSSSQSEPEPPPLTSLELSWSPNDRNRHELWLKYKEEAIEKALNREDVNGMDSSGERKELFSNPVALLSFLAMQRFKIAVKMNPEAPRGERVPFGIARSRPKQPHLFESKGIYTTTGLAGPYESFLPTLYRLYEYIPSSGLAGRMKNEMGLRAMIANADEIKAIHHEGIPYTAILRSGLEFVLVHTLPEHLDAIEFRIIEIYQQLNLSKDEQGKILLILWTVFHLSHAMFWCRGSAAISEMYIACLCKKHNIPLSLERLKTPLDLIALFSNSPLDMLKNICFVLNNQNNDQLSKDREASRLVDLKTIFPSIGNDRDWDDVDHFFQPIIFPS